MRCLGSTARPLSAPGPDHPDPNSDPDLDPGAALPPCPSLPLYPSLSLPVPPCPYLT